MSRTLLCMSTSTRPTTMLCGALAGHEEEDGGMKAGVIRMLLVVTSFCPVTPTSSGYCACGH